MEVMKHYKAKFELLKKIIGKENPVVVEIGAHYGEDSLRFLQTFKDIQLYCFEPDPRNIKAFKKYVADHRVELIEIALSDEDGTAEFYQSHQDYLEDSLPPKYDWMDKNFYVDEGLNNSGSSSLKKGYKFVRDGAITVVTRRFDNWIEEAQVGEVDFAWIDVQGAEKLVLDGMGDAIRKIKFIWIEYGEIDYEGALSRPATIEYMKDRGFAVVDTFSDRGTSGDLLLMRKENV